MACSALLFNETIYSLYYLSPGRFLMSQYAYILVVPKLGFPFSCSISTRRKDCKDSTKQLEGQRHLDLISKRKIHTTENINDVIAHINKTYHLGMLLSKTLQIN